VVFDIIKAILDILHGEFVDSQIVVIDGSTQQTTSFYHRLSEKYGTNLLIAETDFNIINIGPFFKIQFKTEHKV